MDKDPLAKAGPRHAPGAGFQGVERGGDLYYDDDGNPVLVRGAFVPYPSIIHYHAATQTERGLTGTHDQREAARMDELKHRRRAA